MYRKFLLALFISLFMTSTSYGDLGTGLGTGLQGASNENARPMGTKDPKFQQGRARYKGFDPKLGKLSWCLKVDSQLVKLNIFNLWKTYGRFKGVTTDHFVGSFYICDRPEKTAYEFIGKQHMRAIVYYLDKRFKLYLTERSSSDLYQTGDIQPTNTSTNPSTDMDDNPADFSTILKLN